MLTTTPPGTPPAGDSVRAPRSAGIAGAALLITLGNAASRLLGLVREQVIAALFGRTGVTDAFVIANTVPTMLYDLVIGGAVSAALIPVFSDYASGQARDSLRRLASTILTIAFLALGLAVAVLWFLADGVTAVLGAGLAPEYRGLAVDLVRLALPAVIFVGLAGVLTALLYAQQVFVYPAFCVAAYNASIIVAALLLAPQLGATSLVLGLLMGTALQVAVQLPGVRGMGLRPTLDLAHPGVRRIGRLYAPVALGLVISQLGVAIDRNLASRAGEGAIASMRFATTLVQMPLGLVVTAAAFSALPSLSRYAAAEASGEAGAFRATLALGVRFSLFFILPAMVGLIALREPLVALVFERGAFAAADTRLTAWILLFYLPQLPFVAVDQLLIFAFYARKNTLTPMLIGVLGVATYLVAGISLLGPMGAAGLALANSLQHAVHAMVLFILLARVVPGLPGGDLWRPLAKLALAAGALALGLAIAGPPLATVWDLASPWGQLAYLLAMTVLGGGLYLAAAWALRVEEIGLALAVIGRALRRNTVQS